MTFTVQTPPGFMELSGNIEVMLSNSPLVIFSPAIWLALYVNIILVGSSTFLYICLNRLSSRISMPFK